MTPDDNAQPVTPEETFTVMDAEQFDAPDASLDKADAAPRLAAAARKPSVFKRV